MLRKLRTAIQPAPADLEAEINEAETLADIYRVICKYYDPADVKPGTMAKKTILQYAKQAKRKT